jgi:hypothetical protein
MVTVRKFDTFDGAKPRFLNRGKKRRSVLTLSIPRASARGVEWVDYIKDMIENIGTKRERKYPGRGGARVIKVE